MRDIMDPLVIDITRLLDRRLKGRRATGVDRVGLAYVAHFGLAEGRCSSALLRLAGRWLFFSTAESRRVFELLISEGNAGLPGVASLVAQRALVPGTQRPRPGAWLLNVVHSGLERDDYALRLAGFGLRALFFVHDLIPLSHPQFNRAGEAERHRRRLRTAIGAGHALIVNSDATLRSLQAHARAEGLNLPPCVVAHLAPSALPAPVPIEPATAALQPYFLMLGTIEPRKNHALMLSVWRELVAQQGAAAPRLVVIGQRGWLCDEVLAQLRRGDPARTSVHYLDNCSDAELAGWLRHARALLFPSLVEGYGLPLVEALAAGVPVLASELPVFREIAGDIPAYLDNTDAAAWRAAVLAYAREGSPERGAQLRRLKDFVAPCWALHFAQIESLLERADAVAA
jgi:glycosyltransferase involved in cell wall biosynthesis